MRGLGSISYRNLTRRPGRYGLTALGIALGVAVLFAVILTSQATLAGLDRFVDGFAGRADVVASAPGTFEGRLPADAEDELGGLPGVELAVGRLGFRSAVAAPGERQNEVAFVVGIDPERAVLVHDYELSRGQLFSSGVAEVVVPEGLAEEFEVGPGDALDLATPAGREPVLLVGLLADRGAGIAYGGDVVYTSLATAHRLRGGEPGFSQVDLVLERGTSAGDWLDAHRAALGERFVLLEAQDTVAQFRRFLSGLQAGLVLLAAVALFVGAFLIFLTFSIAIAERVRLYGTLRALGARRRQVRWLVVREALALGAVSALAGAVLGYGFAAGSLGFIESLVGIDVGGFGVPVPAAVLSVAVGLLTTLLASLLPARRAAALAPVVAMTEARAPEGSAAPRAYGAVLLLAGLAIQVARPGLPGRSLGMLLILLGAVLLVPVLVGPVAGVVGVLTGRLASGVGRVAVMHLVKERSRSAYTLALVMVVLAAGIAVGAVNRAMARSLDHVVEAQYGADLHVSSPGSVDDEVERRLLSVEGVAGVTAIRFGQTELLRERGSRSVLLVVVDAATYFEVASFPWVEGSDGEARAALSAGGAVLLPEPLAADLGASVGEGVSVRTRRGPRPFTLAGTFALLGQGPMAVVGLGDGERHFAAGRPNVFSIDLEEGVEPGAVRDEIEHELGSRYLLGFDTQSDVKRHARGQLAGFFAVGYAVLLAAAVVGLLGVANTLVVSVIQRTREIGILRSSGARRRQVRGLVLVEVATLVSVAYVLALPVGAVLGAVSVDVAADALEFTVDFLFPWSLLPGLAAGAAVVAGVASLVPARRAARLEVAAALRFD